MGYCLFNGIGVEENLSKANQFYQMAADFGHRASLFNLGQYYKNGFGVEKDLNKAINYFQEAAVFGDQLAEEKLLNLMETEDESSEEDESIEGITFYDIR
jgi:TPR repeat protein